jgi:hypothetical protein
MIRARTALLSLAWCAETVLAQEKREIRGVVVDSSSRAPLVDVEITVADFHRSVRSDERGRFRFTDIDSGGYYIVARKAGFSPESVTVITESVGASEVRIALRLVATLSEVEVSESAIISARLQGFEHRRERKNGGQFITRAEIDRRNPVVTSSLLRRLQGIRMVDSAGVTVAISSRGPKLRYLQVVNCVLRVGVDGSIKEHGFPINAIPPVDIHGIEVYSGAATLPSEFNSARRDAYCGLIMIWTRSH